MKYYDSLHREVCAKCRIHQPMHEIWTSDAGNRNLCCECYVKEGNPPADWHTVCMKTFRNMEKKSVRQCYRR